MKNFEWNNLKAHLGSQDLSFDELSKQLFRKEYVQKGIYRPVGGPGQLQDGVEAIVETDNNEQVGIQVKWFSSGTISGKSFVGRRQQIKESLDKATKRVGLKKWILSIPLNFNDAENKWWESLQSQHPSIKLELWNSDKLQELLIKQENFGIRSWFFGDLTFDHQWFEQKIKSKIECISRKYIPSLHVAGDADEKIQITLGNNALIESFKKSQKSLQIWSKKFEELHNNLKTVGAELKTKIVSSLFLDLDKKLKQVNLDTKEYELKIKSINDHLINGNLSEISHLNLGEDILSETIVNEDGYKESVVLKLLKKILYRECAIETKFNKITFRFFLVGWLEKDNKFLINQKNEKEIEISIKADDFSTVIPELIKELKSSNKELDKVANLQELFDNFIETEFKPFKVDLEKLIDKVSDILTHFDNLYSFSYSIKYDLDFFQKKEIIFLANPAVGKTHLILKACEKQIEQKKPAILILGSQITNQDYLKKQIVDQLDLNTGLTWEQIVQALESYAEANKTRILFAIDAINESPYWENIVKDGLNDLISPLLNSDWFGVIITSRSSYAIPFFGDEHPQNCFFLRNDMDIEEYRKVYFNEYKLKIKDMSPSMRDHLDDRFFVTLLAKVYGNSKADKAKEISLTELTINDLLEDFISMMDACVCKKLKAPTGCQFVRRKMIKLCGYMFKNNISQVSKFKTLELVEEREPSSVRNDDSWIHCMVSEGLLVDFTWNNGLEILEFSHQRVAEYLMACFIVEGRNQNQISELIKLHSNHPRILDILEIVGTLTPLTINKHLYEFLPSEYNFERSQVSALFEMKSTLISESEINWLTNYFNRVSIKEKQSLLNKLSYSVLFEEYPFNAKYVSVLLEKLDMKERDLIWSEWIREHISYGGNLSNLPTDYEGAIKNNKITQGKALLGAIYLKWFLTSTNREIRDKTTRALYWFGRKNPKALFDLTIKSLNINDPYVPERLLASSYGVVMALYGGFEEYQNEISYYAKKLYDEMFSSNAKSATTHLLMRDYARRTIELVLIQYPKLLKESQIKRCKPPFLSGGIRKWEESEDKNEHDYREGNYPLGFDWGNYTLGRIVPNRSPYQDSEEFVKVRKNIFWRIYNLGYRLEDFGQIDQKIARMDRSIREDIPGKTERYGKKYCWIAYFELAGFRLDKGLIKDDWVIRGSEVDIDPSFPENPPKIKVIDRSFIDKKIAVEKWVKKKTPIDVSSLLTVEKIEGIKGKWVLLDGFVSEENKTINKGLIIKIAGILVNKTEANDLADLYMRKIKNNEERENDIPDSESDYYTYAGEIPWCETFPKTKYPESMKYTMSDKKIIKKKIKITLPNFFIENKSDKNAKPSSTSYIQEVLDYKEMERLGIIKKFKIMVPVRNFSWENYHCNLNQVNGVKVINKEISNSLKIRIKPQEFNFFDKNNKQASFSIKNGSVWGNGHSLVYLREDLLNKYLIRHNKRLIWLIWGERQFESTKDYLRGGEKETDKFREKYGHNLTRYKQSIVYKKSK